MKAILDALEKIPVRFEHRWKKIERPDDKIIERLKELKKEDDEKIAKENEEFRQEQLNNPHLLFILLLYCLLGGGLRWFIGN